MIDTISLYDVIMKSYNMIVEFIGRIQIASIFPLQSEKHLIKKMSDKIEKLFKTLVTFNNSSDLMMMSIMVKEGSWNRLPSWICHFKFLEGIQFYLKQVEVDIIVIEK